MSWVSFNVRPVRPFSSADSWCLGLNGPLLIAGLPYPKCVVTEAFEDGRPAEIVLDISAQKFRTFNAHVGVSDSFAYISAAADPSDRGSIVVLGNAVADGDGYSRFGLVRFSSQGILDGEFGGDGLVQMKFESNTLAGPTPRDLAIDSATGKIIAVGYTNDTPSRFIVARFMPDGDLDPSFSGDGAAYAEIFESAMALAVTVQSNGPDTDGDVIVAGKAYHVTGVSKGTFAALARYQADGALDQTSARRRSSSVT